MTAESLHGAGANLRALAEAATPGPWKTRYGFPAYVSGPGSGVTINAVTADMEPADAAFIAACNPPFALAVADWIDMCAAIEANYGPNADSPWVRPHLQMALAVAATLPASVPAPLGDPGTPTP